MSVSYDDLSRRYNNIKAEMNLDRRMRTELATSFVTELATISGEHIDLLSKDFPMLLAVRKYTAEQLIANRNGEIDVIYKLFNDMSFKADALLSACEGAL